MTAATEKIKRIYLPFLLIAVCIIGGYTLLNWLLFIKLQAVSVKEDVIDVWLPLALPWIPILLWLRPRIKLLNLKRRKGDLSGLYILAAGLAMAVPTLVAQSYLETATGKLTPLDNISQIANRPETKYYTLTHFYLDRNQIGVASAFDVSGKYNQDLNMNLYVTVPLFAAPTDTAEGRCWAFLGVKYFKRISNRLSAAEKEKQFNTFANESQADFDTKDLNRFVYLKRAGNTNDRTHYFSALVSNKHYVSLSETVLLPEKEPFEARNGSKLPWIFGSFSIGALVWLIMILIPKLNTTDITANSSVSRQRSEAAGFFSFFMPKENFFITAIVIDLNILVFLLMVVSGLGFISFSSPDLIKWGANFKPLTASGEWWRLLTSTFLHGGLMHLLANMYGLLFVGIFLEPRLGKTSYAIVYLVTGLLASATSLWWHQAVVSVGASGAIFGLYGTFLAFLVTHVFPKEFSKAFLTSTLFFIGYNLVMGLAGGIDNAAHIGGLVSGFCIGLLLSPRLKRETEYEGFVAQAEQQTSEMPVAAEQESRL